MKYEQTTPQLRSLMSLIGHFRSMHCLWMSLYIAQVFGQSDQGDPAVDISNNATPTWRETISAFQSLSDGMENATFLEIGKSDVGRPIHAFVLSEMASEIDNKEGLEVIGALENNKACVLVNNAIHPGEPCGVDASIAWVRDLQSNPERQQKLLSKLDVVIIPMYNVGGALNRNCCTRTNQDGPEQYGFRGNARNLDLNRDFIKMDSQNAESFVRLFHSIDPDVFIDTHTSNGADYPFAMTLITTQPDKAGPIVGPYLKDVMQPIIARSMADRGEPIVPYVNTRNQTPESGIIEFLETPRYSTGFTTLFGTLGFTTEAHMLKSFPVRVEATLKILECIIEFTVENGTEIQQLRKEEKTRISNALKLPVHWTLDQQDSTMIPFKGFESRREISNVTGALRLKYNRNEVWERDIPLFDHYVADDVVNIPEFYILPQAWREVVERCTWNEIEMQQLPADTTMYLKVFYIRGFEASKSPYEGHHINQLDSIDYRIEQVRLFQGDWIIPSRQEGARFLAEILDPRGHDSYFTWNFFDSAMQQKEYYSSYVFEETALEMLESDERLKKRFHTAKMNDNNLTSSSRAQLNWLYLNSKHYEGSVNRYPIFQSAALRN